MHGREECPLLVEIRGVIVQAIDNYGGRDFWYKKVLCKLLKTDNESEERICWGRELQMVGAAKENDLRPISDRISGTIRRFLLENLRDGVTLWREDIMQMHTRK